MTQVECLQETLKHIQRVSILMQQIIDKLFIHGLTHDKSKLYDPELSIFTQYTPELQNTVYGSKEYFECMDKMKPALDHHYKENMHHPNHWKNGIKEMNLITMLEMLADWKAASERMKDGNLRNSIEKNQARFCYSDETKDFLFNTATYLNW